MGAIEAIKATEVLIMLVKAADDQFGGVVGARDGLALNTVNQFGPMTFQEEKDGFGLWYLSEVLLSLVKQGQVALVGCAPGAGLENAANGLLEGHGLGMGFPVVGAIELLEASLQRLQGMKDTVVVDGGRKESGHQGVVLRPQVSDNDSGSVAFGSQG